MIVICITLLYVVLCFLNHSNSILFPQITCVQIQTYEMVIELGSLVKHVYYLRVFKNSYLQRVASVIEIPTLDYLTQLYCNAISQESMY